MVDVRDKLFLVWFGVSVEYLDIGDMMGLSVNIEQVRVAGSIECIVGEWLTRGR